MNVQPIYFLLPATFLFLSIIHSMGAYDASGKKNHIATLFHLLNGIFLMWLGIVFIVKAFTNI